jgi:hypothetical protein
LHDACTDSSGGGRSKAWLALHTKQTSLRGSRAAEVAPMWRQVGHMIGMSMSRDNSVAGSVSSRAARAPQKTQALVRRRGATILAPGVQMAKHKFKIGQLVYFDVPAILSAATPLAFLHNEASPLL